MGEPINLTIRAGGEARVAIPFYGSGGVGLSAFVSGADQAAGISWEVSSTIASSSGGKTSVGADFGLGGRVVEKYSFVLGGIDTEQTVSLNFTVHVLFAGLTIIVPNKSNPDNWNGYGISFDVGPGLLVGATPSISQDVPIIVKGSNNENQVEAVFVGDGVGDEQHCFLAGTMIEMWDGTQKPIEQIRPDDWVQAFDRKNGRKVPGRVSRTMTNDAKIILDFHGTFVTPGHAFYCAGGTFAGSFAPLIDILRDDGIIQHADGRKIRATTNCEVGSKDDRTFWAFLIEQNEHGEERVRDKKQLRLGTRWAMPNGDHFSMREFMESNDIELLPSGNVRFNADGLIMPFVWTLSDALPNSEDFVLRRSQTTVEEIYQAGQWEAHHPRMPAPLVMDSGPVQPLPASELALLQRNLPTALRSRRSRPAFAPYSC